jgi:HEAT repeat protein
MQLVDALGDPAGRDAAFQALLALGMPAAPEVRAGLGDGRWEVRRLCAAWLWRFQHRAGFEALIPLLRDRHSKVRCTAVVGVGHAGAVAESHEIVPLLLERVYHDESLRVRRLALLLVAWVHPDPSLRELFAELERTETDPKLRAWARLGVARC